MKKYLYLIASVLIATSTQADFWDNCTNNGGTIIQANKYGADKGGLCNDPNDTTKTNNCNGKRFCVGPHKIKWWSMFTWCEAIGGRLAPFESVCPGVQKYDNKTMGACPNATGIGSTWVRTSTGWGTYDAFGVKLSSGEVSTYLDIGHRNETYQAYAICEE